MNTFLALASFLFLWACSESTSDLKVAVPECTVDGQVGCVARTAFPAVNKANLQANAGGFKSGNTFAGIAGTLTPCASDNGIHCIASTDYPSVVKSEITAASVVSGSTLAGVSGSFAPACTADAAVDCLATTVFKAVDLSALSSWDVRSGKTIAGLAGSSTFYLSGARFAIFNRTTGSGSNMSGTSGSVADYYDSIDDNAGNSAIPDQFPPDAPQTVSNWKREPTSDTNMEGSCDGMETCAYTDLFTGLSWHEDNAMSYNWEDAIARCEGLALGALVDWRLPTQKELMQAYVDRIFSLKATLGLANANYYSATTFSTDNTIAWVVNLGTGTSIATQIKASQANRVLCVR